MKKLFLIMMVAVLLLSACSEAVSVPVTTATLAETSMPELTSTPQQTPTPAAPPTPDYTKPYVVSSPDSAEFFFPLPEQEWEWFLAYCGGCFPSGVGPNERAWTVYLDLGEGYVLTVECDSDSSKSPQKGSTSEMLAACQASVMIEANDRRTPTEFSQFNFSYTNSGLTIVLSESSLTQALYETKPASLTFTTLLINDNTNPEKRKYDFDHFDVSVTFE